MDTPYMDYVRRDRALRRAIAPALPALKTLSAEQLETLVFYVKSLHGYYPRSESSTENWYEFDKKLTALRDSAGQKALERGAARKLFWAMALGVVAGVVLVVGAIAGLSGEVAWGGGLCLAAIGLFVFAESEFGRPALMLAKEQDRRYFLNSIRLAKSCNELDSAGLFAYDGVSRPGPQSDEDLERRRLRIAELTSELRRALYNDEYMQFSTERPGSFFPETEEDMEELLRIQP